MRQRASSAAARRSRVMRRINAVQAFPFAGPRPRALARHGCCGSVEGLCRPWARLGAPLTPAAQLVHDSCIFVGPIMLRNIIHYLEDPEAPPESGFLMVAAIFLAAVLQSFTLRQVRGFAACRIIPRVRSRAAAPGCRAVFLPLLPHRDAAALLRHLLRLPKVPGPIRRGARPVRAAGGGAGPARPPTHTPLPQVHDG